MKYAMIAFCSVACVFLFAFGLNCFYGVMFPIRYQEEVSEVSRMFGIDEAVVYSIINIESGFDKDAVSAKGAIGLMQVMPTTAQEVAGKIGLKKFELKEASDNILLGTKYFVLLMERFGEIETALAGYNAGPSNVSNWLKRSEYSDDGIKLKKIPFSETEKYIKKFNRSYKYYSKRPKN